MKTIILLIALILCNLGFSCEILPNGNYIPCDIAEQIFEAESRLNEAEARYIESIKKYNTIRHNAASNSFIKSLIKQKVNDAIAKQKANADIAKQKSNADIVIQKAHYEASAQQEAYFEIAAAKVKAEYEMIIAKNECVKARIECDRIYDLAKGKPKKYKNLTEGKTLSEEHKHKISNTLKLRNAKK